MNSVSYSTTSEKLNWHPRFDQVFVFELWASIRRCTLDLGSLEDQITPQETGGPQEEEIKSLEGTMLQQNYRVLFLTQLFRFCSREPWRGGGSAKKTSYKADAFTEANASGMIDGLSLCKILVLMSA